MPDVCVILGLPNGAASFTVAPTGGDTATKPGSRQRLIGPPTDGGPNNVGHFDLQVASTDAGHTANTYRWVRNAAFNSAAPTAYLYASNGFIAIGGL